VAAAPLLSLDLFAGARPPAVPLFYKLLPNSDGWRSAGQLVASIACWLALAAAVAWCVRDRALRLVAFCLVLVFSLSVWITQWDTVILSESLGISLTAAVLAAWLALVRAPSWWTVAGVLAASLAWTLARDTSAYVVLGSAAAVGVAAVWPARRRMAAILAVALVVVFGLSLTSTMVTDVPYPRWQQSLRNVIGARVLTDPGELDWFRDRGMPVTPVLLSYAGRPLASDALQPGLTLGEDPRLEPFRRWIRDRGRRTLATYLLTHPYRAWKPVFTDRDILFATEPSRRLPNGGPLIVYRSPGTSPLLPEFVGDAIYPPSVAALGVWAVVLLLVGAWLAWRGAARTVWAVPGVALALQLPHAAIVWNGDAVEIARHALLVGVMTRASLLLATIFLADAALQLRRRAPARPQPPAARA
jgi:hypothetical protein